MKLKQKLTNFFPKNLQLLNFGEKKLMPLKLFEIVEQFMMDNFVIKSNQFEKTGSIGKTFISLGYLIINFHFRNKRSITFFVTFTFLMFDSGFCLRFNNVNALNLKRNHKSNREKSKLSVNKFYNFFLKTNKKKSPRPI